MTIVKDTFTSINLDRIPDRIELYKQLCDAAAPLFELNGVGLEEACKEHAKNLMYYDMMLQECRTIEDTVKAAIEKIESELYRSLNESNGNRALAQRDIMQYIKSEPKYVSAFEILLVVHHQRRQLEAIVEALKSMGWSLNNIVKLRISQLENTTL